MSGCDQLNLLFQIRNLRIRRVAKSHPRQHDAQCQADWDRVDLHAAADVHRGAENLDRDLDRDSVVPPHPVMERVGNNNARDTRWLAAACAPATMKTR